ncbi:hypothetical protein FQR65_LT00560 [Abscondita terminalis]|nr:hypothetical protein FQR65_LT00560 [Abscondita terminalis]
MNEIESKISPSSRIHSCWAEDFEETMFFEMNERLTRRKNLILFGMEESTLPNNQDRIENDNKTISDLIKIVVPKFEKSVRSFRLGRRLNSGKRRPLKIICSSEEDALELLHGYRVERITFINYVVNDLKNSVIFPRKKRKEKKNNKVNFQTIDETEIKNINVEEIIERALDDAHKDAEHLDIRMSKNVVNISNIKSFQIEEKTESENEINIKVIVLNHIDTNNVDMIFEHDTIKNFLERDNILETSDEKNNIEEDVDLNDYSSKNVNLGVDSRYLKVQVSKKVHNY